MLAGDLSGFELDETPATRKWVEEQREAEIARLRFTRAIVVATWRGRSDRIRSPRPLPRSRESRAGRGRGTARRARSPGRQRTGDDPPEPEQVAPPPRGISPEELVERARGRGKNGGDRHVYISVRGMHEFLVGLEFQGRAERVATNRWALSPAASGWWYDVAIGINGLIDEREEAA